MNEEVRKIIKSSFCPKDKWVPDKDVHNCFKCDEKFHPLFRRKHHCRYCGQIFCNKYTLGYADALIFSSRARIWAKLRNKSACVMLAIRNAGSTSLSTMNPTSSTASPMMVRNKKYPMQWNPLNR